MKQCTKCEESKSLDSFYNDKSRKDGKFPWCKPCHKSDSFKRYWSNLEYERGKKKKDYYKHRQDRIDYATQWNKEHPEKRKEYWKTHFSRHRDKILDASRKYRKESPSRYLCNLARRRAKKAGIEFNIDPEDLPIPSICPLLGIEIDVYSEDYDLHPSVDRIDPTKGYIKGNVHIVSRRGNRLKSNATVEELEYMLTQLKKIMGA